MGILDDAQEARTRRVFDLACDHLDSLEGVMESGQLSRLLRDLGYPESYGNDLLSKLEAFSNAFAEMHMTVMMRFEMNKD